MSPDLWTGDAKDAADSIPMPTLYDYARFYVTGDPSATEPTDDQLELVGDGVIAELYSRYPCLTDDPESELTGADLTNWRRGAGYLVAFEWRQTRPQAGEALGEVETEVQIGPVRKRIRSGLSAKEDLALLKKRGDSAIRRIECVWEALTYLPKTANEWAEDCTDTDTESSDYDEDDDLPTSVVIVTVQTAGSGTGWAPFGSVTCQTLDIVNNTGTDIEYRRGGAGATITIPEGSARAINAITNANQIEVRRVDQSATQVTLTAEAITY